MGRKGLTTKDQEGTLAITEMFYVPTVVWFNAFVRIYRTVDLGKVNFNACKLYCLHKTDFKKSFCDFLSITLMLNKLSLNTLDANMGGAGVWSFALGISSPGGAL